MSDSGGNFLGTSSSTLPSAMGRMMNQNMNGQNMNGARYQMNGNGHMNGHAVHHQHNGPNGHHQNTPNHIRQSRTLEDCLFDDEDELVPFMRPRGKAATFSGMTPFQMRSRYQVSSSSLRLVLFRGLLGCFRYEVVHTTKL
ncbi:hypothetical protein QR680_008192 [Steinernema hermaphroditum]|uniref:Uncharacterized protein n=1 Tax=Steinernema hermaphroditum TaxID=289476 RepID=A0AA39IFR0_9BILA|nr:hypothetical protein QR680_008192 [Steinernema hermaphroditum]